VRTEQEIMNLILGIARADERVRGVLLMGSRADLAVPKDCYQDYDVAFYVTDIEPFFNNPTWIEKKFGKPLTMQMPETMRYPEGDGNFNYQMIFSDGVRIDLNFVFTKYIDDGEPAIVLLDKDNGSGFFPPINVNEKYWCIKPPTPLDYYSCCNNFWWCLNNVAKGIMRDELPYVMSMLNEVVRSELHDMMRWYIGMRHGFNISAGKDGKYFKKYLPSDLYSEYAATYSGSDYDELWTAVYAMSDLFHSLALAVAKHFGLSYRQDEEDGMREYLRMVRDF